MRILGHRYANGLGKPKDAARAARLFTEADQLGDFGAGYFLGLLYLDGKGVERDVARAVAGMEVSAGRGFLPAMKYLAQLYDGGYAGVERNPERALHWYREAAERGDVEAVGRMKFLEASGRSRIP